MKRGKGVPRPLAPYRYRLSRRLGEGSRAVAFVLLNPSTADRFDDDPTIRRCVGFARCWGFDRLLVVNLFALRATRPADLKLARDPVGAGNDREILRACREAELVVLGWGNHGRHMGRGAIVRRRLSGFAPRCLGVTNLGEPRHPLYLPGDAAPSPLPERPAGASLAAAASAEGA